MTRAALQRAQGASWASSAGSRRSMQSNRRVDTTPERLVRSALHRRGLRFRKDFALKFEGTRVRPDIVFTRARVACFIDGCYWHRCPMHGSEPKSNADYWGPKRDGNVRRDKNKNEGKSESKKHTPAALPIISLTPTPKQVPIPIHLPTFIVPRLSGGRALFL
jgi:DNA mismatch endonuclease, patch repair protein